MAQVYSKEKFDLVCFPEYMFLALKPGHEISADPSNFAGVNFIPGETEVTKIGKLKKNQKSSGYAELKMLPGSSLIYAGVLGEYILFKSSQVFPRKANGLIRGKYQDLFVCLINLSDYFCFLNSSNASRLVSKDFEFVNKTKKEQITMDQTFDDQINQKLNSWLETMKTPENCSDLGKRVAFFLDLWLSGLHHADHKHIRKVDWSNNRFIEFQYRGDIATFDFPLLTSLVVLSHDLKLRVEINACNFGLLKLTFHPREKRESGNVWDRIPFIEDHIEHLRKGWGFPSRLPSLADHKKIWRSARNSTPMTLEQAVKILNAGKFRTKEQIKDKVSVEWLIVGDQVVSHNPVMGDFVSLETSSNEGIISASKAIHVSRTFIRRAPPISDFYKQICDILGADPKQVFINQEAKLNE